jgi:opacity protein-like surface antigen
VAGRKLEAGYTLQQQNDFGIEVALGPEIGNVAGFYGRIDYRLGRFIGIKSTFAYVEGGVDSDEYYYETYAMLRYGAGLAKGLQLMRNMELRPYVGVGLEGTKYNDEDISALYARIGVNLALNLSYRFQIIGGAGLYQFIGDANDSDGNSIGMTWDEMFDRSGPAVLVGIKLGF